MCMNSVFMCVFVDYVCLYVFVYVLLSLGVWFFTCVYVSLCVFMCRCICLYICICMYLCAYILHVNLCVCLCVCVCRFVFKSVVYMHECLYKGEAWQRHFE